MDKKSLGIFICLAMAVIISIGKGQVLLEDLKLHKIDPLNLNGSEPYTELTIDQIILQASGGYGVIANTMVGPDGKILAELDMMLTQEQYFGLYDPDFSYETLNGKRRKRRSKSGRRSKRKAIRNTILRWPNATVPFFFVTGHFNDEEQYKIRSSMTEWERYTCLRFRDATSADYNAVRFQNGRGCNSQLGMVGGHQALNLDSNGCRFKGLYLHEIGHAVGLVHEHQLPNRDKYIEILYNNVQPDMRVWFNKYSVAEVNQMKVDYEYSSVMHYGITAFSYNSKAQTIRAKQPDKEKTIGRVYRKQLAFSDVKIVNLMYNCAAHCPKDIVCNDRGFIDQNCNCICPDGTDSCTKTPNERSNADASCFDASDPWQCYVWANQGECDRNPKFMLDMCRRSCKLCGNDDTKKEDGCKDVFDSQRCEVWKDRGECVVNKKWMEKNCKKTCKVCGNNADDPDVACNNKHSDKAQCDKWANEGECFINPTWMPENCQKSCRMCGDSGRTKTTVKPKPDPDSGKCEDDYNTVECQNWANDGECTKNPRWMIPNCRKSCRKCDEKVGECKNNWDDNSCIMWARDQECMKNRDWMHENCRQACTKCTPDKDSGRTVRPTVQPTITTSGDIKNNHKSDKECDNWAKFGHCEINDWMLKHCALSCKRHSEGALVTTTTRPDRDDRGQNDGNNDNGGNDRNDENDRNNDNGGGGNTPCVDLEHHCPSWAENGFCEDNPTSALRICKKSCNVCVNTPKGTYICDPSREKGPYGNFVKEMFEKEIGSRTGQPEVEFQKLFHRKVDWSFWILARVDTIRIIQMVPFRVTGDIVRSVQNTDSVRLILLDTQVYARSRVTYVFMHQKIGMHDTLSVLCITRILPDTKYCKKSCNVCAYTLKDCFDKHQLCPVWANGGHCNVNSGYMLRNCQKACRTC